MEYPETEFAWAAGFFDGEGSSICTMTGRTARRPGVYPYIYLQVKQSGDKGPPTALIRLQTLFGGRIHKLNMARRGNILGKKQQYVWMITSAQARHAMARMIPYLDEVKLEQYDRARIKWHDRRDLNRLKREEAKSELGHGS
jgi:hypothetical protein